LIVWTLAQSRGDGHRSLVTPERVLNEHNEDLILIGLKTTKNTVIVLFCLYKALLPFSVV